MKLSELLKALPRHTAYGSVDPEISTLTFDSRTATPGSLFVAIRGWDQDGHRFIPEAIKRGASVIVAEDAPSGQEVPAWVVVPRSRQALALLAAAFNGFPGRQLTVVGVTGTDGKTTTCTLAAAMLNAAGLRTGLLSTIRAEYAGRVIDTGLHTTTPSPLDVQRHLSDMVGAGMRCAVLETTSHALDQERTLGAEYDLAVATNVTPEHLDYHKSYGRYLQAKGKLFASLASSYRKTGVPKVSITNADDTSYGYLREFPADRHLNYGISSKADVRAEEVALSPTGCRFRALTPIGSFPVDTTLPGRYNVYNTLAAIAVAIALGVPAEATVAGASAVGSLTGRWERVETGGDFGVVIDFAHTPRALEEALRLARTQASGRVIVVFGCAGLRDRAKRPIMGEIAGKLADVVVLTAEDPRSEDVGEIMNQIAAGCRQAGLRMDERCFAVADRAEAIAFAVAMAQPGDLVLVAGKGHERSLCIGDTEYPWSEHDAVAAALARRGATGTKHM